MYRTNIRKILNALITTLHVILFTAMVVIGLISLFRPDIMREIIDWM